MEGSTGAAALKGPRTSKSAKDQNIKRDPFEQAVGEEQKSVMSIGGALAAPSTAYLYNWNMLPVGRPILAEGTLLLHRLFRRSRIPAAIGNVFFFMYFVSSCAPRQRRGGIGAPAVDTPVSTSRVSPTKARVSCARCSGARPLVRQTWRALYPTHRVYVDNVTAAADDAVAAGFLLPADRDEMIVDDGFFFFFYCTSA